MTKQEKIRQIKYEFQKTFEKLDRVVKTTNLREELQIFLKLYNLKQYIYRKTASIDLEIRKS